MIRNRASRRQLTLEQCDQPGDRLIFFIFEVEVWNDPREEGPKDLPAIILPLHDLEVSVREWQDQGSVNALRRVVIEHPFQGWFRHSLPLTSIQMIEPQARRQA